MSNQLFLKIIDKISLMVDKNNIDSINITFHGGEPLLRGFDFYKTALPALAEKFAASRKLSISIQSNLHLFDENYAGLFRDYKVKIGTSLDGPEKINDQQRGRGCFQQTMKGLLLARRYRLNTGCIVTFTPFSAVQYKKVIDFFLDKNIPITVHGAVPATTINHSQFLLGPAEYGKLLKNLFNYYLDHSNRIKINLFDEIVQAIVNGEGRLCTFKNCADMFRIFDADGTIYPCQRFCGMPDFSFGNVEEPLPDEYSSSSSTSNSFCSKQFTIQKKCGSCEHEKYCQGGCFYNAVAAQKTYDPYCLSYKTLFDLIKSRLAAEFVSPDNIRAVIENRHTGIQNRLLKQGKTINLIKKYHPTVLYRQAQQIIAAYELGKYGNGTVALDKIKKRGVIDAPNVLKTVLKKLKPGQKLLNNVYLHITRQCQQQCSHCYYCATENSKEEMQKEAIVSLIRQTYLCGFRKAVITGGEPLLHSNMFFLLKHLSVLNKQMASLKLVLRTNFVPEIDEEILDKIAYAFDYIIISIDGDEAEHDKRRGAGSFRKTIHNATRFQQKFKSKKDAAKLCICGTLSFIGFNSKTQDEIMKIAESLQVSHVRINPLLPLGRAHKYNYVNPPESMEILHRREGQVLFEQGFIPKNTCGLGCNLFIDFNGDCYPCHAYYSNKYLLGNCYEAGLTAIVRADAFLKLQTSWIEKHVICRECEYRYLCGGLCNSWLEQIPGGSFMKDTCYLRSRSAALLSAAQSFLDNSGFHQH